MDAAEKAKMRIGDIIVYKGYVTQQQLQEAFRKQRETGLRLGEQLVEMKLVNEEILLECLCWQKDVPMMNLQGVEISPTAFRSLPEDYIVQSNVLPVDLKNNELIIVHSDPLNLQFIADEVTHKTGKKVKIAASTEQSIKVAIEAFRERMKEFLPLLEALKAEPPDKDLSNFENLFDLTEASTPMISFANMVIRNGIKRRATDIYIQPCDSRLQIRYRVDGLVQELLKFPADLDRHKDKIVARFKTMAGLDISEKRMPQDGKFRPNLDAKLFDCRLSIMPTVYGEKAVIRILYKDRLNVTLDKTGLSNYHHKILTKMLDKPHGLVLVTGPTGSGKTTTLYAALAHLWSPDKSVVTVEDPVEYEVEEYSQSQVNPDIGLNFATLLRSLLRQAPDVMLVGEIRDSETAKMACEAAMTGHMVLSTLHSNSAPSSVLRLSEIGVDKHLLGSVLLGSLAQRLVRTLCMKCREKSALSEDLKSFAARYKLQSEFVYKAKGCVGCLGAGYLGRVGVHEIMQVSTEIGDMICAGAMPSQLIAEARKKGFVTIKEDAMLKVLKGQTDLRQVLEVAG